MNGNIIFSSDSMKGEKDSLVRKIIKFIIASKAKKYVSLRGRVLKHLCINTTDALLRSQ